MSRPAPLRLIALSLLLALFAASVAIAQPTFGPKKKPRPDPDAPKQDGEPNMPPPPEGKNAPGATQTPEEWGEDDPPRKAPDIDAKPGEYFCWKTADGLRYAWSLPAKFEKGKAYDLVVMLHPDRADFHWGPMNHMRGEDGFVPDCVVVSVDGMAANARRPEARSFEPTAENCVRFRDVILEFSRNFPARQIYLYGQGGGGKFAVYFAGAFPALADGVLDHGGGIVENSAVKTNVPTIFLHGAKDSMTPFRVSLSARDELAKMGHPAVYARILRGYNDFTSESCSAECIDCLRALRTDDPAVTLECVKRMLTPKGQDEFGYTPTPWFAGAHAALARFTPHTSSNARPFQTDPTDEQKAEADKWVKKLDAEAKASADNIRRLLKQAGIENGNFVLNGSAYLGYMLPARDDFRGIKSMEDLATELKLDEAIAKHCEAAQELWQTWTVSGNDEAKFERATDSITECFLCECLPNDLLSRCRACMKKADQLELEPESKNRYEFLTLWDQSWRDGLEAYELRIQQWTGE
jgi:dienelactone hydrolase